MTPDKIIMAYEAFKTNKITLIDLLNKLEQYSNSQHDGNPLVSLSLPAADEAEERAIDTYVMGQLKVGNIAPDETIWLTAICDYWYNKGKLSAGNAS